MPAAVPIVVSTVIAATVKTLTWKIIGTIAVAYASQKLQERKARSEMRRARAQGVRYNVRGNIEPLPVIYGSVPRVPGIVLWRAAHGSYEEPTIIDNTQILTQVIAWSEGPIWAMAGTYVNDVLVTDSRFPAGYVSTANYVGDDDQEADPYLVQTCAAGINPDLEGKWTADHRARGVAYTRVSLVAKDGLYGPSGIPVITGNVLGRTLYDPRNGSTYVSSNPALVALDYLRNSRYGAAVPDDEIDFDSFADCAAYCDEKVIGLLGRPRRWSCDIIIDPTDDITANLQQIFASCRGALVFSGGQYRMIVDRPRPVTFALTEDNLVGEWQIELDSLDSRVNRVRATFVNATKQSQPDFVLVEDAGFLAADGGELLEREIELPGVTLDPYARDLAEIELRSSRYGVTVQVNALATAMQCEVGDVVSLTHSVPGWIAKEFIVLAIELRNTDEVRLTLREYSVTVYPDQSARHDMPVATTLPNPLEMPAIVTIGVFPNRTDVVVRWKYHDDLGARWFDVQWIKNQTVFPPSEQWVDASTSVYEMSFSANETSYDGRPGVGVRRFTVFGLEPGTQYALRIRARSSLGGQSISWSPNIIFDTLP